MVVPHYSKIKRSPLRVPVLLDENTEKKASNPLAKVILNQLHQATYPQVRGKVTSMGPRKETRGPGMSVPGRLPSAAAPCPPPRATCSSQHHRHRPC